MVVSTIMARRASPLGLLSKVNDAAIAIDLHQTEGLGVLLVGGQRCDSDVRPRFAVLQHEVLVVHAV